LANALIEIRQDLIASDEGAEEWAERFARSSGLLQDGRNFGFLSFWARARGIVCASIEDKPMKDIDENTQ
jgi:hypothetical protein